MGDYKYATRFPEQDKPLLESTAQETGQSINQLIVRCVHERLPAIRAGRSAKSGRITNVTPLPDAVLRRLYAKRDDDEPSIRRFIEAQPRGQE